MRGELQRCTARLRPGRQLPQAVREPARSGQLQCPACPPPPTNARALRASAQLRQVDVAARAGISRTVLSVIEGGGRRITIEDILALCRGLDVGLVDLLAGADPSDLETLRL